MTASRPAMADGRLCDVSHHQLRTYGVVAFLSSLTPPASKASEFPSDTDQFTSSLDSSANSFHLRVSLVTKSWTSFGLPLPATEPLVTSAGRMSLELAISFNHRFSCATRSAGVPTDVPTVYHCAAS